MIDSIPFPQADDFDKILLIINITDEELLIDNLYMQKYLKGITSRQVSYFLSAAMYIGLIDKNKKFTELGNTVRKEKGKIQVIEIINILLSDDVIRYSYIYEAVLCIPLSINLIGNRIQKYYPDYSLSTCRRRAQTVCGWVEWIQNHLI
ncbi:hypothetical protein [Solobacterium sp.]|jgi:modification methylase (adenine-specific DNAmethyltransferase)|uniref:DUF7226 domain-containing protein n=1 Tax=Solobacterium sp. TaxID=2060878 RepID=UPI001CB23C8B|nr:hypothetical protein [Solobacterium sp.]MBF1085165.1 hypothetical protein [Solobacterium sp.]